MSASDRDAAAMVGGATLLERAMNYTLGSLSLVTDDALDRPTPCVEWDTYALLVHMRDSLEVLSEAAGLGRVVLEPVDARVHADESGRLVATVRDGACRLLGAWAALDRPSGVAVGDRTLPSPIVAVVGAIEVAVHGWDLARACGHDRSIPDGLAVELLELAPILVRTSDRSARFALPLDVPVTAPASTRLLAYLGRRTAPIPPWRDV